MFNFGSAGIILAATITSLLLTGCADNNDPFDVGRLKEHRQGTPTPATSETAIVVTSTPVPEQTPVVQEETGESQTTDVIRIVTWDDNRVKLVSFIAGYILFHGHQQKIEILETEVEGYKATLLDGHADLVMETSADWHQGLGKTDKVTSLAQPYTSEPDILIGINAGLTERAPYAISVLQSFAPGDKVIRELTARMSGGRMALRDNVAAIIFLKQNEDVWTKWVTPDVAERVKTAVAKGNNSLCNEWVTTRPASGMLHRVCKDTYVHP